MGGVEDGEEREGDAAREAVCCHMSVCVSCMSVCVQEAGWGTWNVAYCSLWHKNLCSVDREPERRFEVTTFVYLSQVGLFIFQIMMRNFKNASRKLFCEIHVPYVL